MDLDLRALNADIEAIAKSFRLSLIEKFESDDMTGDWGYFTVGDDYCNFEIVMDIHGVVGITPSLVESDAPYFANIYDILIKRFTSAKKFTKYLEKEIKLEDYDLEIEE